MCSGWLPPPIFAWTESAFWWGSGQQGALEWSSKNGDVIQMALPTKKYKLAKKKCYQPFFDASGNKNNCASISIGREIRCLPYAGFFLFDTAPDVKVKVSTVPPYD